MTTDRQIVRRLLILWFVFWLHRVRRLPIAAVYARTKFLQDTRTGVILRTLEAPDRISIAVHGAAAHHVVTPELCECASKPALSGRSSCRLCSGDVPRCRSSTCDCALECACHVAAAELRLSAEQSRDELRDLLDEQQDEKRCEHRLKEQGKILGRVVDKL